MSWDHSSSLCNEEINTVVHVNTSFRIYTKLLMLNDSMVVLTCHEAPHKRMAAKILLGSAVSPNKSHSQPQKSSNRSDKKEIKVVVRFSRDGQLPK